MIRSILLLIFLSTLAYTRAQEGCPRLITPGRLSLEIIRAGNIGDGVTDVNLVLTEVYLNCLAAGSIRGYYRQATYTVRYRGIPGSENTIFTAIIDVVCFERNDPRFWVANSLDEFRLLTNETEIALLTTNSTTQTNCQRCNAPTHTLFPLDPQRDDLLRHCQRCPDACLENNLTLCYGFTENECCNVYNRGGNLFRCAVSCADNFTATEETDYVCTCDLGCQNGGYNNDECNMCICPQNTTGSFCETILDPCNPNPCQNGGQCNSDTYPNYTCTCPPGFTGVNCTIVLNPCDTMPCLNGATCSPGPGPYPSYTCTCPPGFTGVNCSTPLDPCANNPCRNGGTCNPGTYPNFTCTCPPRFTGANCETDICQGIVCQNGGVCEVSNGQPVCRCQSNFVGARCENCTIPNCSNCSLTRPGVCLACEAGFQLSSGTCILDCRRCNDIDNNDQKDICNFFCELQQWRDTSLSRCNLNSPSVSIPSPLLNITQQYNSAVSAARGAEVAWNNGVSLDNIMTPTRSDSSLTTWRAATRQWVSNLMIWLEHIRSIDTSFTNFDLSNLLANIDNDSMVDEVHMGIRTVWLQIFNEFNSKQRCF